MQKLIVFDTTLRDGEQSPGVTLSQKEKIEIAQQLSRLGVDVCEAGFPIASAGDFESVKQIAIQVGPLVANPVKYAPFHRIHMFLATSDIHLEFKLKISREECKKRAADAIKYAKNLGVSDIEFSPEDAGRSDKEFLCDFLANVIEAGATTLNIPDTVGYNTPAEYGNLINYLIKNTKGAEKVFSFILGLATANTLSGVLNGARQVEVTINGIGERAGNTALEEVIMAIHTHPSTYSVSHLIDTTQIYFTSQLVTNRTGMVIQANKAIVGANAFSHESGIHQDGVLKHKATYEIISPETIGLISNSLVLGKHSGRNAFRTKIESMTKGSVYEDKIKEEGTFERLFSSFKKMADLKKGLSELDLYALLDSLFMENQEDKYKFVNVQVVSGSNVLSTATVTLSIDGAETVDAAIGDGPVHAIFGAINRLTGMKNTLESFDVQAITDGSDSLGKVTLKIEEEQSGTSGSKVDGEVLGTGLDTDILVASAKAYVDALNRQEGKRRRQQLETLVVSRKEGV